MAVSEYTPIQIYTASGLSAVFAFNFLVLQSGDMKVTVNGTEVTFSISGVGNPSGGTVTLTSTPVAGAKVAVFRDTDLSRATDYQVAGDLDAETLDADFDRLWLALQEVAGGTKASPSSLRVPVGETVNTLPAAASRAGYFLGFDATGQPVPLAASADTAAALAADLANATDAAKGAALVGFAPTLNYTANTIGWAVKQSRVSVNLFSGVDPTGAVDCGTALNAAVAFINALGGVATLRGIYRTSVQITNTGFFAISGESGAVVADYGNSPIARVQAPGQGAVIRWVGSNSTPVILQNPDVGEAFSIRDVAVTVTNDYGSSIVRLKGCQWYLYTGPTPQVDIDGLSLYRDSQATTPGSSSVSGIEFDLTDSATPRAFFGARIRNVFAFGLNQVYFLNLVDQTTPSSGNFFNSNTIGHTHAYKCYRIANIVGGTTANDQASLNHFGPWYIQPVGDNLGNMATGVLRLVNNVNRNTFDTIVVYDLAAGGTPRRFSHVNPFSPSNSDTWNRYINCADFEVDASGQMANYVDGALCIGGTAIGLTGANFWLPEVRFAGSSVGVTYTVQLGRFVRQGRMVTVELDLTLNALGAQPGGSAVQITLPVDHGAGPTVAASIFITNGAGSWFGYAATIAANSGLVDLSRYGTSGSSLASTLTKADVQTGTTIRLSATYMARL